MALRHSSPEATASGVKPSSRSTALRLSRMPRSSSTIRIDSDISQKSALYKVQSTALSSHAHRKFYHKPCPSGLIRFRINPAAMLADYSLDDRQAQARATPAR